MMFMERKKSWKKIGALLILLLAVGGIFNFWGLVLRQFLIKGMSPVFGLYEYFGEGSMASEEEKRLEQIFQLKAEEYEKENQALRRMLDLKERMKTGVQAAHVLWYGKELGREMLLVDIGRDANIEEGYIAVDAQGFLVGTIREVGNDYAKISVASNPGEAYEIEFLPVSGKALARGIGARTFSVELIPADFSIRKGDFVLVREPNGRLFFLGEIVREEPSGGAALKQARAILLPDPLKIRDVLIFEAKKPAGGGR